MSPPIVTCAVKGIFDFVSGAEQGIVAMLWIACEQCTTDSFAESDLIFRAVTCGAVQ